MRRLVFFALVAAAGAGLGAAVVFGYEFVAAVLPHGGLY